MVCGNPNDDECLRNPDADTCFGYDVWRDGSDSEQECILKSKVDDEPLPAGCGPQSDDGYEGVGPGNLQLIDLDKIPDQPQCDGGGASFIRCVANKGINVCLVSILGSLSYLSTSISLYLSHDDFGNFTAN